MKKLDLLLKRTGEPGLLHNSRKDVVLLMEVINAIHNKVNELIDENEELKEQIEELKKVSPQR